MSEMNVVMRLARPTYSINEIVAIKELRNSKENAHLLLSRPRISSVTDIEAWMRRKEKCPQEAGLLIVYEANKVIGYMTYDIEDKISRVAWVGICIDQAERGKGAGKKSLQMMLSLLRERMGIRKVCYRVREDNAGSRRLFKSLMFQEIGRQVKHYYADGYYYDVIMGEIVLEDSLACSKIDGAEDVKTNA